MAVQYIQSVFVGYGKDKCTVYGGYDPDSGILSVSKVGELAFSRYQGCVVISNSTMLEDRDCTFTEDDFPDALRAFFALSDGMARDGESGRLIFAKAAERAKPAVEKDMLLEQGQKYRIPPNMSNAQAAVLGMAWYVSATLDHMGDAMNMCRRLTEAQYRVHGLTRGNAGQEERRFIISV